MTKRLALPAVFALCILLGCSDGGGADAILRPGAYTIGTATVLQDGIAYEPARHFLHGASGRISASGVPFGWWLEHHIEELPVILYTGSLQITVEGRDGQIVGHGRPAPADHDGMKVIGIRSGQFLEGTAEVSLPDELGTYIVFFDVIWRAGGFDFTEYRYTFLVSKGD
jgi:hypothetical protein